MSKLFYEIGGAADLITPLVTSIQNIYHGSVFHINIRADCGYSVVQVENALRQKGIYVWGGTVIGEVITFNVRSTQAEYALYWLERWQIPIDGHSQLAHKPTTTGSNRPPSAGNVLDLVFESVNALTRKLGGL